MALTIDNAVRQGACGGVAGTLNGGNVLLSASATPLVALPFASWGAATLANPSVAIATITPATPFATGVITNFAYRNSSNTNRISGTVSMAGGGGDMIITDTTIPSGTTQVSSPSGFSISLTM
jgi:hypothetical protein